MNTNFRSAIAAVFGLLASGHLLSAETNRPVVISQLEVDTQVEGPDNPDLKQARQAAFDVDFLQLDGTLGRLVSFSGESLALLDWDGTFLGPFQKRAGEGASGKPKIYVALGKTLGGLVHWAAYRGDAAAVRLKEKIVDQLIATQDPDGYIGAFDEAARGRDASWDTHEATYIMKALEADHRIFGKKASGEAASRLAEWIIRNWGDIGVPTWGMESCFLEFKDDEGNFEYAQWIFDTHFPNGKYKSTRWGGPLGYSTKWDDYDLSGKHVYYFAATAAAQLLLNKASPNPLFTRPTEAAESWMKDGGASIDGTFGYSEKWTKNQFGRSGVFNPGYEHSNPDRDHKCGEVCSHVHVCELMGVANRTLEPESWRYDVIERVLYNSLAAAQSREAKAEWKGSLIRYDTPFEGPRPWYWRQTFCCPGNFRRFVFEIPRYVYQATGDTLYINLYESSLSEIRWKDRLWKVRQETGYPRNGVVHIRPQPDLDVQATLALRIPAWADGTTLKVNGESFPVTAGTYAKLTREWKATDVIELNMPMDWKWVQGYREQKGRAGLMRGPLVFALNPSVNAIPDYTDLKWEPKQFGQAIKDEPPGAYAAYQPSYDALREIVLDGNTVEGPLQDTEAYPKGIAASVKGWSKPSRTGSPHDLTLRLTEFPDEGGRMVYYRLSDPTLAVPDPVFAPELKETHLFAELHEEVEPSLALDNLRSVRGTIPSGAQIARGLRSSYDEMVAEYSLGDQTVWMSVKGADRPYRKMGFRLAADPRERSKGQATIHLIYLDQGNFEAELFYDSLDESWDITKERPEMVSDTRKAMRSYNLPPGALKSAGKIKFSDSGKWRRAEFRVDDARLSSLSDGKDFVLFIPGDRNTVVGGLFLEQSAGESHASSETP